MSEIIASGTLSHLHGLFSFTRIHVHIKTVDCKRIPDMVKICAGIGSKRIN